ncbi:helix-turn-helix domain-containing protein [Paenibacillus sp. TCA20]|uniref:helix-turn-helix domain-containing protein n=1 Tax=Paenibacillus sp. TCA20 TaxID=1499968 RepID=UPI00064C4B8D|nr:helix-turn-helix domain-containing protein [Paenibacillus sp. TCA20]
MKKQDDPLHSYLEEGDANPLMRRYHKMIRRYSRLLVYGEMDFKSYDSKRFISCFIREAEIINDLCKAGGCKSETIEKVYDVIKNIRDTFSVYDIAEIEHELLIVLLECAHSYKEMGFGFSRYVYSVFRYRVKRFVDNKMFESMEEEQYSYKDDRYINDDRAIDSIIENRYYYEPLNMEVDEYTELDNILWLNGIVGSDLFKELSYSERFILLKAYDEGMTDREIARINGLHHRSVYRIRKRIADSFREKRVKGEIKCLR